MSADVRLEEKSTDELADDQTICDTTTTSTTPAICEADTPSAAVQNDIVTESAVQLECVDNGINTENINTQPVKDADTDLQRQLREYKAEIEDLKENQKTVALSAISKVRRHEQMIKSQTEEIQSLRKALEKSKSYRESNKSDITVTSDRIEIDKLKDDLESKHSIITSMEASQKTMSDLLADKNAVIESQRLIIDGIKSECVAECARNLKELENNLQQRNEEITGLKDELKRLEKSSPDDEYEQLLRQVHMERETNALLTSKLEDQRTITQKTEYALQKLEELVSTKSMLIENLQSVISCEKETQKSQPSCPRCDSTERNLTSQPKREISNDTAMPGEVQTMTSNADLISESADMVPHSKMVELTEHYDAKIKVLNDDLKARAEINRKTDTVLQAKEDLLSAKDEIISNLKVTIDNMRNEKSTHVDGKGNETSNTDTQESVLAEAATTEVAKNGVKEACEFIEVHAINGAIINPFLLWADIQRKMHPENKWKEEAPQNFVKTEITEAKEMLWRIVGEEHLGKMIKRQGSGKCTSEVTDICSALRKLSEKDKLPLFLCTSGMVARTPICGTTNTRTPICGTTNLNGDSDLLDNYLHKINDKIADTLSKVTDTFHARQESPLATPQNISNGQINVDLGETIAISDIEAGTENETRWTRKNQRWKTDKPPAANQTDLVISKVKLNVVGLQIRQHFANNDVEVDECKLMTTRDDATFLTYRIRVKKNDAEKLKDPSLWPNGTEMRPYKPAKARSSAKGDTAKDKGRQTTIGDGSSRSGNATNMRAQQDTQRGNAQATNFDNHQETDNSLRNQMMGNTTNTLAPHPFTFSYPGLASPNVWNEMQAGIVQQHVPIRNNSMAAYEKQQSTLSGTHPVDMNESQGQQTTQRRFPLPGVPVSPVNRGMNMGNVRSDPHLIIPSVPGISRNPLNDREDMGNVWSVPQLGMSRYSLNDREDMGNVWSVPQPIRSNKQVRFLDNVGADIYAQQF